MRARVSTSVSTTTTGVKVVVIDVIEALFRAGFGKKATTDSAAALGAGRSTTGLWAGDTVGTSTVCEVDGLLLSVQGSEHRGETVTLAGDVCGFLIRRHGGEVGEEGRGVGDR